MEKKGLGWINDKTLKRLSTDDIQRVFNYRRLNGSVKRLETTIEKDTLEIERLTEEIKKRKQKIKEHKKTQKEIYDRFVQYTDDWLPVFWIVLNVKKTLPYYNCTVRYYNKRTKSNLTKSIYLGSEQTVVRELKKYFTDEKIHNKLKSVNVPVLETKDDRDDYKDTLRCRTIRELLKEYITDYLFDNLTNEDSKEKFYNTTHTLGTIRQHYRLDDEIEVELTN